MPSDLTDARETCVGKIWLGYLEHPVGRGRAGARIVPGKRNLWPAGHAAGGQKSG